MAQQRVDPMPVQPFNTFTAEALYPRDSSSPETADRTPVNDSQSPSMQDEDPEKQSRKSEDGDDEKEEKDPNIVDFEEDGSDHPQNWPSAKKWLYAVVTGFMTLVVTFASSVFSSATMATSQEFGVSTEVMTLGTSLFVLGFAFGPIVWGPASELYGRKVNTYSSRLECAVKPLAEILQIPLFVGYFIFMIFQIPIGVAQNLQTIFICRFFGGFFASAPLAIVGGLLADFFDPVNRGLAICVFSGATFIGPVVGPIIGGFVTQSYLGWRWTAWITMIMAALMGVIGVLILPESLAPVLLRRKADRLRHETGNWALHAKVEESKTDFKEIAEKYLLRPFAMLFREPILALITIYMSFIYGVLYMFFEVYPITFQEQRGYNLGVGALPFISIGVGVAIGAAIITYTTVTRIKRKYEEDGEITPEERLIPMMIGAAFLPIGLFWFAWTSNPNINPWPQIIAGVFVGAGIQQVFLTGLSFIIDVYIQHANSALAANTFVRSWFGAGLPLAAMSMYGTLGVPWATSLLGFVSVVLFPVPIVFYIYGEKIRSWSKYAA